MSRLDPAALAQALLAGERRALAQAITLVESTRAQDRPVAETLLTTLAPHTGKAVRLGISGVPGVGKSTFIEALGLHLTGRGHRLAVLAVDPSSQRTGGSILGDKTRMELLSREPAAFIRPSPAGGNLGGVASRTRESLLLCEAAGYDVVVVETVGVGQSETAVAGMVDCFLLLQLPNAGDELQALKKGVVELADLVVINKADINPQAAALAKSQFEVALHLLRPASPNWSVPVLACSALRQEGIAQVWETVMRFHAALSGSGELADKRAHQALSWLWTLIGDALQQGFRGHPAVAAAMDEVTQAVIAGRLTPAAACRQLMRLYRPAD
ncbi:MAG: methylmalonyl Co-A mutase-associated GTPase MeaB [Immundisolibacter sp.]|uniref:methylmalonyl Co-A mutase-associated GTPase MeaB n=1 Tax=Immundisolibacter sp. TaxID=1934948 RepID=UPI00198F3F70|nr:methylmalonyl Co-A mutase-associated GTPase MeaB [Immundisolibacter sp.]MBC7161694.1 methylmalonyl Co-A mutase-associated GTPase MeaB [Immundisolibacter sp.]